MSNSPERPTSIPDPYAPKRLRDHDQKPRSIAPADDYSDDEPPITLRRMQSPSVAPPPLIGRPPLPPAEPSRSFITAREVALLAIVSIVSALVVIAFYKLANDVMPAGPRVAANATRAVPAAQRVKCGQLP